uniref:Uncharacterized protein n=1 Tax=Tanacetum cinerariifolium TaxID=118510 RepID=A0A6L2LE28_TANCI|nr:hypothetical protein [Tanacetum cinerariifolium]
MRGELELSIVLNYGKEVVIEDGNWVEGPMMRDLIRLRGFLGKAWYWRMKILRSVLFRKEIMVGPKGNRVKVAEKEETGKFHGSFDGGP